MKFTNKNIENLKSYVVSSPKAWNFKNKSEVLKLDWNESTIKPSPKVFESIIDSMKNKQWNWYPNINNTDLIDAIASYCKVKNSQIQFFASSDVLHEYIVRCFVSESDRILVVSPTYDNFRAVAEANNGKIQNYPLDSEFKLNLDKLDNDLKLIKPKIMYLVNPNNPTGTEHDTDKLKKLISNNVDVLFIVDEAYFEFNNKTISQITCDYDNLIISRTFSKAFGLASFRIGYCIANESIIEQLNKIRNPKNVSLFAQEAALAALKDIKHVNSYVKEVNMSKNIFFNFLSEKNWIKPYDGSGNFIFMEVHQNLKNHLISFLESKKVFVRDYGHIKRTINHIRITVGTKKQTQKVMSLIDSFESQQKSNYSLN